MNKQINNKKIVIILLLKRALVWIVVDFAFVQKYTQRTKS